MSSIQKVPASMERIEAPLEPEKNAELLQAAKGFESIFIGQMVSAMRQTVQKSDFIPHSQAEKIFESMLDTEYAQKLADTEQIGLSHLIYEHLLRSASR